MKTILGAFCALMMFLLPAFAQEKAVKKVAPRPTSSIDGKSLFHEYCAVCHGANGKGGGPAASALKVSPGDLTMMAKGNGGKFPEDRVLKILKGEQAVAAHGSMEMPIWGKVFNDMGNLGLTQTRLHALLEYVDGLQAK